jgi:hypothetical protein
MRAQAEQAGQQRGGAAEAAQAGRAVPMRGAAAASQTEMRFMEVG